MTALRFVVPGEPKAWERARRNPATGRIYNSRELKRAEADVGTLAKAAAAEQGVEIPIAGPVELLVVAASRRANGADLSNIVKLVEDGLNKVAWHDDKQVVAIGAHRVDRADVAETRVEVRPARGATATPRQPEIGGLG